MAVTREFNSEKQSKEKGQAQFNSTPEAIDNMVSNFLAELRDLSSEMSRAGNLDAISAAESETHEVRISRRLKPEEEIRRQWVPDLERIDEEIEQALAELEALKPTSHHLMEIPLQEDQPESMEPPVETPSPIAVLVETIVPTPAATPEPKLQKQPENEPRLFERSIYVSAKSPRRGIGFWILAAFILIVLAVSAYFYFGPASGIRQGAAPLPSDVKPAQQVAETNENGSAVPEIAPAAVAPATQHTPVEAMKSDAGANDRSTSIPKSPGLNPGARASQSPIPAIAAPEIRHPAETAGNGYSPERTGAKVEPSRSASSQNTGAASVSAKPAPMSATKPAAFQPKPASVVSSYTERANGQNTAAVPAIPKPALPDEENAGTPVQPRAENPIPAEVIMRVEPEYPALAKQQKIEGVVEVEVDVNEKGFVIRTKAVAGPYLLRTAAEIAALKWKFRPASINGVDAPTTERISMNFKLQ